MGKLTNFLKVSKQETKTKVNKQHKQYDVSDLEISEKLNTIKLDNVDPVLLAYHDPESIVAENFKILRSHILHPRTGLPSKLVMVTSAVPGEGKSFVAINLAFSFARSVPTILIEADLRRPSFGSYLHISSYEGLNEYLLDNKPLLELVYKTDFDNLYIIPAGRNFSFSSDIFSSERLVEFLDDLRHYFPKFYIIFDCPPALFASETLSLSRLIDGVLLVVRYAYSDRDVIEEAVEKIGKSKILGFVFNGFNISSINLISSKLKCYRYPYYYYSYSYKKYHK